MSSPTPDDHAIESFCPCGVLVATTTGRCPGCGRRAWTRHRLWARARERAAWLVAAVVMVGAGVVVVVVNSPDEAARVRRMRDAAGDRLVGGDSAGAAGILETCVQMRPDDATAWRLLACALLGRADPAGARAAADRAFQLSPTSPGAALTAARCRAAAGDAVGALQAASGADEPWARVIEARALLALARPVAASEAYSHAGDAIFADLGALTDATRLAADLGARPFPGAAKLRARAAKLGRRLDVLAKAAADKKSDDPLAALAAAVAADVDPTADRNEVARRYEWSAATGGACGGPARTARVEFLLRAGRRDDARKADDDLAGAQALVRAGDAEGAIEPLRALAAKSPDDVPTRVALVIALLVVGKPSDALAAAGTAATTDVDLLTATGDAAAAADDRKRADACYDAALLRRPGEPSLVFRRHGPALAALVESLAAGREALADEAVARAVLDRVRAADPDDLGGLAWASRVAAAEGRAAAAFDLARSARSPRLDFATAAPPSPRASPRRAQRTGRTTRRCGSSTRAPSSRPETRAAQRRESSRASAPRPRRRRPAGSWPGRAASTDAATPPSRR
ncbi:MAG: hypothetical protein K8T90_15565 [Planctomycetes bacterium]|nr:hypothetical protein [Planctomycetota bacterium]